MLSKAGPNTHLIISPTVFLSQSELRGEEGGSAAGPRGEVSGLFFFFTSLVTWIHSHAAVVKADQTSQRESAFNQQQMGGWLLSGSS